MRHGQTDLNRRRLYTGLLDVPLNQEGIRQCFCARDMIKKLDITHVYSSGLQRAIHTAICVTGKAPTCLKELNERDFGILSGGKKPRYNKNFFPNAESYFVFRQRVQRVLSGLDLNNILIVSHSRVFYMICEILNLKKISINNAEIVKFYKTLQNNWEIKRLQDTTNQSTYNWPKQHQENHKKAK